MTVHVIIKRKYKINKPEILLPLLNELSMRAQAQPGYISTETLQHIDNLEDYMVVSKWDTAEDWQRWFLSKERRDIQGKVDSLIGERTFYDIFQPVS